MRILEVEFVTSAARAGDVPRDQAPQLALVGRSNVGKSSLINALTRRPVARTSAAAGKTRLANIYRVRLPSGAVARGAAPVLYLVDLPGYGYARGGQAAEDEFEALTRAYFGEPDSPAGHAAAAIQVLDARHPGLQPDLAARAWLDALGLPVVVVVTKIDRLARSKRIETIRRFVTLLKGPVLPVSAATGEGMDALWEQIVRLVSRRP